MNFTLRQLQVFLTVAQTGSISEAAKKLSMSQSAASGSLKELENRFNLPLYDRVGKRLKINSAGIKLQAKANELLDRANEIESSLKGFTIPTQIRAGATMTVGNYTLVDYLAKFKQEYESIVVQMAVANTEAVVDGVIQYQYDLGFIEGEVSHPDIDVVPWKKDEMVLVCSPDNTFAGKGELNRNELVQMEWIVREQGSGSRQTFERGMYGILQDINCVMELDQIEAIKRATVLNMGAACLSRVSVERELASGELIELSAKGREFNRNFYVILHKDRYLNHAVEQLLEFCGIVLEEPNNVTNIFF